VPRKYEHLIHHTTQIPRKSIEILVKAMDSDGDYRLTAEDIRNFSHAHFITLNDEVILVFKKSLTIFQTKNY
jgi:hypothetical protein